MPPREIFPRPRLATLAALLALCSAAGPAPAQTLSASSAPVGVAAASAARPPRQHTSAYNDPSYGLTLDVSQREWSRIFFQTIYKSGETTDGWTGNIDQGIAGTTTQAFKDATALRINYFRAMAGVPAAVTFSDDLNAKCQQAALMLTANYPTYPSTLASWRFYTADGAAALASSIHLQVFGPAAISTYVWEKYDASNVDERRWILYPPTTVMGTGDVFTVDPVHPPENVLWAVNRDAATSPPTRDGFVAWPPPGYVPYLLVWARWSLSYPGADFSTATVNMTRNGQDVPVHVTAPVNGAGDNTLVWIPADQDTHYEDTLLPNAALDATTTVKVDSVLVDGVPRAFTYQVTGFNPYIKGPDTVSPALTGPDHLDPGQASDFSFNAVPYAAGYQWRAGKFAPATFTADATTYPRQEYILPNGEEVVYLDGSNGYGIDFLDPLFLPTAGSQMKITADFAFADSTATARAQISFDGAATWQDIYTLSGPYESVGFEMKIVDLGPYAGRHCQLRLIVTESDADAEDDNFVYLHDITVTGAQTATWGPETAVGADSTSISFSSPSASDVYVLQVTPLFYGGYPVDDLASLPKLVSVGTPAFAPVITSAEIVSAGLNAPFSYRIAALYQPTAFSAGTLPPGLNLDAATGILSGTPTQTGTFSVPLGATNAIGTGTATLSLSVSALPTVTLSATGPSVTVGSGDKGVFTLSLSEAQSHDVVVNFTIKGSAANGTDYAIIKGTKKIKAGKTSKPIKIVPQGDLGGVNKKTIVLKLAPGDGYLVGTTDKIKVKILSKP